ncbi:MMPL family transporter [Fodinicola acaciae]|uniref:MMPL family transporter n=1 Tax=Fodinicola acaciae TaxID=2681555 RepID=UPI0013D15208|nr:MMPL family transporter [Fodinicola acaciae]
MPKSPAPTVRVANWSARHPWPAIGIWAALIIACVGLGAVTGTNQLQGKDGWVGEQGRAAALADAAGLTPQPVEKVLITAKTGAWDRSAADAAAADLSRRLAPFGAITTRATQKALLVKVTLRVHGKTATKQLPAMLAQTAAAQRAFPRLDLAETGTVSTGSAPGEQLGKDLARAETITLPVTLVILLVVFGGILAAGVPMVLALTSVFAAMGLYAAASYVFPDAGGAVANIVLMLGMAVGVDYSLFYVKRVREERERAGDTISHETAVRVAAATSGRAVVVSALAIVVTMIGLYLADDAIYSSVATGTILVVLVSAVSSLTVLPAILAKLGTRITRQRRFRHRVANGFWPGLLRPVMRRPVATLALAVAGLVALSLPLGAFRIGQTGADTYPRSLPAIANYHQLVAVFPDEGYSFLVVAKAADSRASLAKLATLTSANPLFVGRPEIRTAGDTSTLTLPAPYGLNDSRATQALTLLRTKLLPEAGVTGSFGVTGEIARALDYVSHQRQRTPLVIGFALLATFGMLLLAFRSVPIAIAGIFLNLLSYTAALGAVVLVFQNHWAEKLLGFESVGFISDRVPLILFVILFGLSMDYQVFVVSRIREAAQRGVPTRQAAYDGVASSAGVVTIAAVIMVSVFASFLFVGLTEMKEIAFGLALSVLIDAIVVRVMILPALLTLLGEKSWWPAKIRLPGGEKTPGHPVSLSTRVRPGG